MNESMMRYLAIVPARGGSVGVPGKNIRPLLGKPMLVWTIEHALECSQIGRIVVSTDSPAVAAVAENYGVKCPQLRPPHLAQDDTPTEPVLLHVIEQLEQEGYASDAVVLLQPTSPFRRQGRLAEAIRQFESERADSLLSVCLDHSFFWTTPERPQASYNFMNRPLRQNIPHHERHYRENGSIYITRTNILQSLRNRLGGRITLFVMEEDESHQVDTLTDFTILEQIMTASRAPTSSVKLSRLDVDAIVFDFDGVLTDNRVYVDQDGQEVVSCNRADGMGFEMLRQAGLQLFILSKEANPVVAARGRKVNVPVIQNVHDKGQALDALARDKGIDLSRAIYVGNDLNDLPAMSRVAYAIAVADAHASVHAAAWRVLSRAGGNGVVREIAEDILGLAWKL
jgi:YrbI family 3-deoxy-D-manno-octulosonate 8-phosphate phosphatase